MLTYGLQFNALLLLLRVLEIPELLEQHLFCAPK